MKPLVSRSVRLGALSALALGSLVGLAPAAVAEEVCVSVPDPDEAGTYLTHVCAFTYHDPSQGRVGAYGVEAGAPGVASVVVYARPLDTHPLNDFGACVSAGVLPPEFADLPRTFCTPDRV